MNTYVCNVMPCFFNMYLGTYMYTLQCLYTQIYIYRHLVGVTFTTLQQETPPAVETVAQEHPWCGHLRVGQ